jgi:hypothetical protein
MLAKMEGQVRTMDVSQSPTVVFLKTVQAELQEHGIDTATAERVVENMNTDIGANTDPQELNTLALAFAKVIVALLRNPTMDPLMTRHVVKGLSFTYNS